MKNKAEFFLLRGTGQFPYSLLMEDSTRAITQSSCSPADKHRIRDVVIQMIRPESTLLSIGWEKAGWEVICDDLTSLDVKELFCLLTPPLRRPPDLSLAWTGRCHRCGVLTSEHSPSTYNNDLICKWCKDDEMTGGYFGCSMESEIHRIAKGLGIKTAESGR